MKLLELLKRLENIKNNNVEDIDVYFVDDDGDFIEISDLTFNYPDMISEQKNDTLFEDENVSDEKITKHIINKYSTDIDGKLYLTNVDKLLYSKPIIALGNTIGIADKSNGFYSFKCIKISESYKIIEANNKHLDKLYDDQAKNKITKESGEYKQYLKLKEKFKNID